MKNRTCFTSLGLPGQRGGGSYAVSDYICLAMISAGSNKEGSWSFMRQFLLPQYQNELAGLFFPIREDAVEKVLKNAANDGEWKLPDKDVEKLRELIYSADIVSFNDDTLYNLVSSEAESFFSGGKSLDEAAALIESKLNIYLAEHS